MGPDKSKKVKILVVDDEELICWSLKQSFEKVEGYSVNCAYTGNDAVQKLIESQYDVVITDLNLPDARDLEIVEKIKKLAIDTPVIVISSHLSDPGMDNVKKQGVIKWINKPFEIEDVLGGVKEAMKYNTQA
ncbi:MAG: response regulator [Nitrospirae bacterium]|nr:response regulator [Nitrospirota bacterium]